VSIGYAYEQYFGLEEHPFSITPDPRFVYLSERHREALQHLEHGASGGVNGFVLLTGDVGTGKTMICRTFLERLPPKTEVALILNPVLTLNEFLQTICDELNLVIEGNRESNKNLIDQLNRFLLQVYAVGQKTILIVDEAQNLSQELLEQLRLLTNLETATDKLLQIFLIGQPELRDMLKRPEMLQVSQRITSRYHLGPLSQPETEKYILHRLDVAGAHDLQFTNSGIRRIFAFSKGVPRLINVLSDRALITAYERSTNKIDSKIVRDAESRVTGAMEAASRGGRFGRMIKALGVTVLLAGTALAAGYWKNVAGIRPWVDSQLSEIQGLTGSGPVANNFDGQPQATVQPAPPPIPAVAAPPVSEITPTPVPAMVAPHSVSGIPATGSDVSDGVTSSGPLPAAVSTQTAGIPDPARPADSVVEALAPAPAGTQAATPAPPDRSAPHEIAATSVDTHPAFSKPEPLAHAQPTQRPPTATGTGTPSALAGMPLQSRALPAPASLPDQSLAEYTRRYAERKLLSMWGITDPQAGSLDFCQRASRHDLYCLTENSGLAGLHLYDRPAILYLTIDDVSSYAVVMQASPNSVVLDVLDQEHVIPARALKDVWEGSFMLLWKKSGNIDNYLTEGATGHSAVWLRRAIDLIEGRKTTGSTYDAPLVARVKQFQRTAGLAPDGIVGPRTLILLQNRLAETGR
jgi:general secretion pathway protein A